ILFIRSAELLHTSPVRWWYSLRPNLSAFVRLKKCPKTNASMWNVPTSVTPVHPCIYRLSDAMFHPGAPRVHLCHLSILPSLSHPTLLMLWHCCSLLLLRIKPRSA